MSGYRAMPTPQTLPEVLDVVNKIQEHLARQPERLGADEPGSDQLTSTAIGKVRLLRPVPGAKAGLAVPPAGDIVAVKGSSVAQDANVKLRWAYTAASADDIIMLLSDGKRLVEVARSTASGATLLCPAAIYQTTATCNPVLAAYPYGSASAKWALYLGAALDYVEHNVSILPGVTPITLTPLYINGGPNNSWKDTYSWTVHCHQLLGASKDVTLSSATYNPLTLLGGYTIYRLNPTVPIAEIRTMSDPTPSTFGAAPFFDMINVSTTNVVRFIDQAASYGTANERIIVGSSQYDMGPNGVARAWYDFTSQRWRLLK